MGDFQMVNRAMSARERMLVRELAIARVIYIGWKEIGRAVGGLTEATIKKIAGRYAMPLVSINGRPSITRLELECWWCRLLLMERLPLSIKRLKHQGGLLA